MVDLQDEIVENQSTKTFQRRRRETTTGPWVYASIIVCVGWGGRESVELKQTHRSYNGWGIGSDE